MSVIENISDTARWVAYFRAEESERDDAIFHDPFARKLAGEKGQQIAKSVEFSKVNSWSFVARTFLFDEFILRHISQGYDMVINLAAGLDARPYRMELPSSLQWIEVDLPGILKEKEKILADEKPNCQLQRIQLDLSKKKERLELFRKLNTAANRALIVTEGLVIYLTEQEVASLALDLSSQKSFRRWLFDLVSPGLLVMIRENLRSAFRNSKAEFRFAPNEGEGFFLKYGWEKIESRSQLKTAATLNRLSDEMMKFAAMPNRKGQRAKLPGWVFVFLRT